MKTIVAAATLAVAFGLAAPAAQAAGCIKGAIAGGVAGHFAGHHGLLGAGAGCVVGRHVANSRNGAQATQQPQYQQPQSQQQYPQQPYQQGNSAVSQ